MEENNAVSSGHKRRNSIPSAVIVPTSLHNGHHNHHINHYYHHHRSHQMSPSPSPASLATADFELVSFKSPDDSYTSLKDLIPTSSTSAASILSPPPNAATSVTSAVSNASPGGSGYEISIRNRLVKQAAWAYLQPTISSSPSSSRRFFYFFSGEFLRPKFATFRRLVIDSVTRGYDWLVDALWLILCR